MNWQPIETAPKDGTLILATGWDGGKINTTRHYCLCQYNEPNDGFINWSEWKRYGFLTHWIPLQSPEDEKTLNPEILKILTNTPNHLL